MSKVKTKVEGDSSLMTYTGHTVLQTLIRCHFSPDHTTGQSLIYTGCAAGRVVIYDLLTGEIVKVNIQGMDSRMLSSFFVPDLDRPQRLCERCVMASLQTRDIQFQLGLHCQKVVRGGKRLGGGREEGGENFQTEN